MEYVFGKRLYDGKECEYVRTSDSEGFSNLVEGAFTSYVYTSGDISVTHNFRVLRKYKDQQSVDGKVYFSWYLIDNHTKETDKTAGLFRTAAEHTEELADHDSAIDDIIIELLNK